MAADGRAVRSGLGEYDQTLRGIKFRECADGDHGDFVLLLLSILAGDGREIGRLAPEPEIEGLGAGRCAELSVGDQLGEEVVGERGDLKLILVHEFERGAQDVGLTLEERGESGTQAGA